MRPMGLSEPAEQHDDASVLDPKTLEATKKALSRFQKAVAPMMEQAALLSAQKLEPSVLPTQVTPPLPPPQSAPPPPPPPPLLENQAASAPPAPTSPTVAEVVQLMRPDLPRLMQVRPELPKIVNMPPLGGSAPGQIGAELFQINANSSEVQRLVAAAQQGPLSDRRKALFSLGDMGEAASASVPALTQMMLDPRNSLAQDAYRALGRIIDRDPSQIRDEFLNAILKDDEETVGKLATEVDLDMQFTVELTHEGGKFNFHSVTWAPGGLEASQPSGSSTTRSAGQAPGPLAKGAHSLPPLNEDALMPKVGGTSASSKKSLMSCTGYGSIAKTRKPREFRNCTWLILAVLSDKPKVVRVLLQHPQDLMAQYSTVCGTKKLTWSANVAFAACNTRNLKILSTLMESEHRLAFMQSRVTLEGSAGGDLLWEAAYFGYEEIVQYLLDNDASVESIWVKSRDNTNLSHTAAHTAVIGGDDSHYGVLKLLVESKADLEVDNRAGGEHGGVSPLEDAIVLSHPNIVRLLVENDLLFPSKAHGPARTKNVRALFRNSEYKNSLVIAAAAEGLRSASEEQVRQLQETTEDGVVNNRWLVKFLQTPGEASVHIMEAIFRKRNLQFFALDKDDNHYKRYTLSMASLPQGGQECIATELSEDLAKSLMEERRNPDKLQPFLDKLRGRGNKSDEELAPLRRASRSAFGFLPPAPFVVDVYACILPDVHEDAEVIVALATCDNLSVFGVKGCEAFVRVQWQKLWWMNILSIVVHCILLLGFFAITVKLNEEDVAFDGKIDDTALRGMSIAVAFFWLISLALELRECVGLISAKKADLYFRSPYNILDVFLIFINGLIVVNILQGTNYGSPTKFRCALGVAVFFRWTKVIAELRTLNGIGTKILPIVQAIWDTKAFNMLLLLITAGFFHMYYSLGISKPFQSWMLIFRLAWLGDFDVDELQNVDQTSTLEGKKINPDEPDPSYDLVWFGIRFIVMIIGWLFTVVLMNIYIAVLSVNYDKTVSNTHKTFTRERMKFIMQDIIYMKVQNRLLHRRGGRDGDDQAGRDEVVHLTSSVAMDSGGTDFAGRPSLSRFRQSAQGMHIWFCTKKESPDCEGGEGGESSPAAACVAKPDAEAADDSTPRREALVRHTKLETKLTRLQDDQSKMLRMLSELQSTVLELTKVQIPQPLELAGRASQVGSKESVASANQTAALGATEAGATSVVVAGASAGASAGVGSGASVGAGAGAGANARTDLGVASEGTAVVAAAPAAAAPVPSPPTQHAPQHSPPQPPPELPRPMPAANLNATIASNVSNSSGVTPGSAAPFPAQRPKSAPRRPPVHSESDGPAVEAAAAAARQSPGQSKSAPPVVNGAPVASPPLQSVARAEEQVQSGSDGPTAIAAAALQQTGQSNSAPVVVNGAHIKPLPLQSIARSEEQVGGAAGKIAMPARSAATATTHDTAVAQSSNGKVAEATVADVKQDKEQPEASVAS